MKIWLYHCSKLAKWSLHCENGEDWAKNRIWPHMTPIWPPWGSQMGNKIQFFQNLTLPLFKTCKKVPSLHCKNGEVLEKNKIWPRLAPFGPFLGQNRGLRDEIFQIWLQILTELTPSYVWRKFGKNRFMGTHFLAISGALEFGKTFPFLLWDALCWCSSKISRMVRRPI